MAEEFPSFDLGFYFLNYQNAEAGNSSGDTATDQKKKVCRRDGNREK